jgi:hypothetical protein
MKYVSSFELVAVMGPLPPPTAPPLSPSQTQPVSLFQAAGAALQVYEHVILVGVTDWQGLWYEHKHVSKSTPRHCHRTQPCDLMSEMMTLSMRPCLQVHCHLDVCLTIHECWSGMMTVLKCINCLCH